jgi:hypothetical protein
MEPDMTSLPFKLQIDPLAAQFLFTVRGPLTAPTIDKGREAHNLVAGSDQAVAAARSFGDLSHAVYVPVDAPTSGAGELFIVDYWNSPEGLGRFFSDPQVQKGGAMVYKNSVRTVWQSSPDLPRVILPAPFGRNDRWAGVVRGPVASREAAAKIVTEAVRQRLNIARSRGLLSREWYFKLPMPGDTGPVEAIGLDVWFDAEGMQKTYAEPEEMAGLVNLFTGKPETSVWQKPAGLWVEW